MRLLLQSFLLVCCSSSFGMDNLVLKQELPKLITWHPNVPMHVAQELPPALKNIDTLREIMRFLSYRTNIAFVITCKNLSGLLNNKWQLPGLYNESEYTKAMIFCAQVNDRACVEHLIRCSDSTNRYSRKRAMQYFAKPDTIDGIIDVYGRICDTNDKYDLDLDQLKNIMREEEDIPAVRILLEQGYIDPNVQNKDGETALHWVVGRGYEDNVKLLLSCGKTDPNVQNKYGETALHLAWCDGIVKLLLNCANIDLNVKNKFGTTALDQAFYCGYKDIVGLLSNYNKS